ncbi:MAG TPA: Ig-like domain-containing protein [Longimicrobiales bacterium]|nr:Ig-like domain-containing protein [Longimicrobiales bacterium]
MRTNTVIYRSALAALVLIPLGCGGDDSPTDPDPTPEPTSVVLSETSVDFPALGDSTQVTAEVHDQFGDLVAGSSFTWSTTDDAVATVSDEGWVLAVGNGSAGVIATSGSLADTVAIEVAQVPADWTVTPDSIVLGEGDDQQVTVTATDANGFAIENPEVEWESTDEDAVAVDTEGRITAVRAGRRASVYAMGESLDWEIRVRVLGQFAFSRGTGVFVANEDGSGVRQFVETDKTPGQLTWTVDGSKLAFVDGIGSVYTTISAVNADGTGYTDVISTMAMNLSPTWSPNGMRIAYMNQPTGGDREIYVADADGGNRKNVSTNVGIDQMPAWSPDSSYIAFTRDGPGGMDLWMTDPEGESTPIRLTTAGGSNIRATWSPDAARIAFVSFRDGNYEIYTLAGPNAQGEANLTNNSAADQSPAWSPDAEQIAFVSDRGGNPDIYVMDADGGNVRALTSNVYEERLPVWSADGSRIFYLREIAGTFEVYSISVEGGAPTRLTEGSGDVTSVAWRP